MTVRRLRRIATLAICLACAGCHVAQPESARTVAAFEVPLPSQALRAEFLDIARREAGAEGLHVDAAEDQELEELARAIPLAARTIHAGVWRGAEDDAFEAGIMDGHDHLGQVWIVFLRGEDPALAARFRERLMRRIRARWPATQPLPVAPTGAIPLRSDLCLTREGYRVKRDAAQRYELPDASPLVARC